jgi:hypothetical protein
MNAGHLNKPLQTFEVFYADLRVSMVVSLYEVRVYVTIGGPDMKCKMLTRDFIPKVMPNP